MLITPDMNVQETFHRMAASGDPEAIFEGVHAFKGVQVPRQIRYLVASGKGAEIRNPADGDTESRCLSFLKPGANHVIRGIRFNGQWKSGQPGVKQDQQCSIFAQGAKVFIDHCDGLENPACW